MAFKLAQCGWHETAKLNDYLAASWEPFAVTETDGIATVWLRRPAYPQDAAIDVLPHRGPRHEPEVPA